MISTLFIEQLVITLILNSNLKLKRSPDPAKQIEHSGFWGQGQRKNV